jgi:hypothetical protein
MIVAVTHHGTVCTSKPSPATKNEPSGINTVVSNDFASGRDACSSSSEVSTGSRIVFEYRRIGRFTKNNYLKPIAMSQDSNSITSVPDFVLRHLGHAYRSIR